MLIGTPIEIHFTYLGNQEIYCIFKDMVNNLFFTKIFSFHNFIFSCPNIMFFINYVLKFKY